MPGKVRLLIAIVAVVGGVAGCQGKSVVNSPDTPSYQTTGDPYLTNFPVGHRQMVGDVSGKTLQGAPISLSQYRGKVVVVNFWSSNCAPCDQEAQWFETMYQQQKANGVQFVGIDERDNQAAGLNFERSHSVTYPSIFDQSDAFVLDFPGAVPSTTPFTVVLDRQGEIAAKVTNSVDFTHLREMIDYALQDKTT